MGGESVSPVIRYLRTMTAASGLRQRTDAELLQAFVVHRDETAFAVLVQRYGPLVLGVCRRLLGHEQAAEDAFQATFLVLVSKAASVRRRESVASFLHGVAERIARKSRRTLARRRDRAMSLPEVPMAEATPDLFRQEVRRVLDEEIRRLPRCYRDAFILCYLEGHTNAEAARRLGCPKGTVLSRLARARDRLARQLRRRDITLPAATLTTLLAVESLRAAVPSALAGSTVRLAALLSAENVLPAGAISAQVLALATEGVQTMFWKKMTVILAMVLAGSAATAAVLAQRTSAPSTSELPHAIATASSLEEKPTPKPPQEAKKPETPLEKVLREWAEADENVREMRVSFTKTEKDIFDTRTTTKGQASLKKPDLWRVDLLDKSGRSETVFLRESKLLHWFDRETKTEKILPIPRTPKGNREASIWFDVSSFLKSCDEQVRWFAFGPQARDVSPRFTVRLAKEDQWYSYLDITPRGREDKKWMSRARVVLTRDGYHVRQLWLEHSNGTEDRINYLDIRTNPRPPITRESLLMTLPKGWKRIEPPKEPKGENE
jgi:RNA polymerase sigma factor (sigma-70 family)